jgi:hypothetical protein
MKRSRAQLQAELMAEATSVIEECLAWHAAASAPTLTEIEEVVLRLRERLGQRMAEVMSEEQATNQPVAAPVCPHCGEEMCAKGRKAVTVGSRVGELGLRRGYYYCAQCQTGIFPPR